VAVIEEVGVDETETLGLLVPACCSTEIVVEKNRARQLLIPEQRVVASDQNGQLAFKLGDGRRCRLLRCRAEIPNGKGQRGLSWAAAHRPTGPRSPTKRLLARFLQRPTAAAHGRGLPGLVDQGFKYLIGGES